MMTSTLMPAACQLSFALLHVAQRCAAERAANHTATPCDGHVIQRRVASLPSLPLQSLHFNNRRDESCAQVEAVACYVASVNPSAASTVLAATTISSSIAVSRPPALATAMGTAADSANAASWTNILKDATFSGAFSACQLAPAISFPHPPPTQPNEHPSLEKSFDAFNCPRKFRTSTILPLHAAPRTDPLSSDRLGKNTPTLVGYFEHPIPLGSYSSANSPANVRCSFAASAVQSSWAGPAAAMAGRITEPAIALPDRESGGCASPSLAKQFENFHVARNKVRASIRVSFPRSEGGFASSAASQQPSENQEDS
ncbi:hypothetical protein CLOM_g13920 [Closterium sp. NIES-68]|nr:hypothetical protein CLOM_g13920 [Closterium sp. NIES-68]GJP76793.1 hypothetical protein CLOP_g7253 [Closterium sp. NIES-67]